MAKFQPQKLFNKSALTGEALQEFNSIIQDDPDLQMAIDLIATNPDKSVTQENLDDLNRLMQQSPMSNKPTNTMSNRISNKLDDALVLPALLYTQDQNIQLDGSLVYQPVDIVEASQEYAHHNIDIEQFMAILIATISQQSTLFLNSQFLVHEDEQLFIQIKQDFIQEKDNFLQMGVDADRLDSFELLLNNLINQPNPVKSLYLPTQDPLTQWFLDQFNQDSHSFMLPSSILSLDNSNDPNQILAFVNIDLLMGASNNEIKNNFKNLEKVIQKALSSVKRKPLKQLLNDQIVQRNSQNKGASSTHSNDIDSAQRGHSSLTKINYARGFKDTLNFVQRHVKKAKTSKHVKTSNKIKTVKRSLNRPNRRFPDNPYMSGKIKKYQYRPDLHIYIDTSGSMSVNQYEQIIRITLRLAKKLNVDLYITSFSHVVSDPIRIDHVANSSINTLWRKAKSLPTVTGGTEFVNVLNRIQERGVASVKAGKMPEITIMATDLQDNLPYNYKIPKYARENLYIGVDSEFDSQKAQLENLKVVYDLNNIDLYDHAILTLCEPDVDY